MKGRGPSLREEDDSWRTLLHAAGHSFMNWSNGETMNGRFPPLASTKCTTQPAPKCPPTRTTTPPSGEFTKEALVIRVKRKLNSTDVVDALTDLFILRGPPAFIRSDNGAEFFAKKVRTWIGAVGAKTAFIAPGSPWENGYCESFNARFRDELLNGEVFYTLREAQILIERWRRHYNTVRPHSALGYLPPAPESIVPIDQRPTMH
jgi:hypothetical protein